MFGFNQKSLVATAAVVSLGAASARAQLIAVEDFKYPAGVQTSLSGGYGWAQPWQTSGANIDPNSITSLFVKSPLGGSFGGLNAAAPSVAVRDFSTPFPAIANGNEFWFSYVVSLNNQVNASANVMFVANDPRAFLSMTYSFVPTTNPNLPSPSFKEEVMTQYYVPQLDQFLPHGTNSISAGAIYNKPQKMFVLGHFAPYPAFTGYVIKITDANADGNIKGVTQSSFGGSNDLSKLSISATPGAAIDSIRIGHKIGDVLNVPKSGQIPDLSFDNSILQIGAIRRR